MFPSRPRLSIPVVIRKTGEKFIPDFPVEMKEGDQLIIAQEMRGWQCPKDKMILSGYTTNGPVISD